MSVSRLNSLLIALAFVLSGIVLLLFNLHLLGAYQTTLRLVLTSLFALGGLGFGTSFFASRQNWWRLIPAWTLLALALIAYLNLSGQATGEITAALLFVGLALAFGHVYWLNRLEHWWALMPGGFMLVLSAVIVLSRQVTRLDLLGALLFIGLGLVFGLVYALGDRQRHWWALLPGTILVLFGLFFLSATTTNPNLLLRWWPLALVIIGPLIGWWGARQTPTNRLEIHAAKSRSARNSALTNKALPEGKGSAGALGEYTRPAPGASVEILPDQDR